MTNYLPRQIAPAVDAALRVLPVVVVTGLRQAGKSTLLLRDPRLQGRRYLSLDDFAVREAARRAPGELLAGGEPLSIDEAQRAPELLLALKAAVDRDRTPGRFLLSGSASFALLGGVAESLAGRAVYLTLHPLTHRELAGEAAPPAWLGADWSRPPALAAAAPIAPADILRGGLPPVRGLDAAARRLWFRGYEQTYLERDLRDLAQVGDLLAFRRVLQLAALRTGQVLNRSELARDAGLAANTMRRYLDLGETSYVLRCCPPYLASPASRLIKSPKLYVADSGLAAHLAGVDRLDPAADEPRRGALAETWAAQNLAALVETADPPVRLHYWHIQGRHEVDFVLERGRELLAVEIKAGSRWGERDLAGLRAFLQANPRCRAGWLAYNGTECVPLGERLWAVPLGGLMG